MHPNDVPGEYTSEHEHVDRAKNETVEADPRKTGQGFENGVMELHSRRCPPREKPSNKTKYIDCLHAQYALPPV